MKKKNGFFLLRLIEFNAILPIFGKARGWIKSDVEVARDKEKITEFREREKG